jgi:hypothetical protein
MIRELLLEVPSNLPLADRILRAEGRLMIKSSQIDAV